MSVIHLLERKMKYNKLGRTNLMVSEVGFGCEHLKGKPEEIVNACVDTAIKLGINAFDIFRSEPNVRTHLGNAFSGRRDKVIIQGHFCVIWKGAYTRTREIDEVKWSYEDLLTRLQTDYIDVGMVHFIDSEEDFNSVFESDIIKYALKLKEEGTIRSLGFSSHSPKTAMKVLKTGLMDVMMFSINPAYDLLPDEIRPKYFDAEAFKKGDISGLNPEREQLYQMCVKDNIGVTVMKNLAAGKLLKAETSPFGVPLSVYQCMNYALSRPAVASVMLGMQTVDEVKHAAAFSEASESEKDYSEILISKPAYSLQGKCMYCNHCHPCAADLDIAQINKYLDLVQLENKIPSTIQEHYNSLEHTASECIECGVCEPRCPFNVPIIERMRKAAELFGH